MSVTGRGKDWKFEISKRKRKYSNQGDPSDGVSRNSFCGDKHLAQTTDINPEAAQLPFIPGSHLVGAAGGKFSPTLN